MPVPTDPASRSMPAAGLVTTRLLGAPREAVLRAFTDPAVLERWWGPEGFTNRLHRFDPRPGGAWRFTMTGPDGAEYEMDHRFVEVTPEGVVVDHLQEGHDFRLEIGFAAEEGGTRITWRMRFASAEEEARVREVVAAANEQNLDRLERVLYGPPAR